MTTIKLANSIHVQSDARPQEARAASKEALDHIRDTNRV